MFDPRTILAYAAGAALVLALAAAGTQTVRLSNERTAHAGTKATHATTLESLAERTARAATAAQRAQQAQQQVVAAIDTQRTQEAADALSDNESRRAADRLGTGRLRIAAICPGPSAVPGVPSAATAPGVDPAAAEISPAARQLVWDLRATLITERAQLLALQDYARACATHRDSDAP